MSHHHSLCRSALALTLIAAAALLVAPPFAHAQSSDEADTERPAAAPDKPRHVDLDEAISLGLTRSPQIDAAELSTQKAALVVDEAFWAWTPKLELNLTIAPFPEVKDDTTTDADVLKEAPGVGIYTKNSLEFVMPIFTSFKYTTANELAAIGLDVEKLREEEARLQVTWDVTRAYYGLQLANALADVLSEAESLMGRVEKGWRELYDAGSDKVSRTDQYEIDIARASLEALAAEAREKRQLAREALRVHTRLQGAYTVDTMRFTIDEVELRPLDEIQALARTRRLDLRQLEKGLEAADLNAQLQWLQWWPDFYIAGGINLNYNNAVPESTRFYDDDPYNTFGVGILAGMRWKLDPANRAFKVDQAEVEAEKIRAQRELAYSGAMLQVEEAYLGAQTRQARVQAAQRARRSAKRLMTQELLDYESGGGDVDDAIRAVQKYFDARTAFLVSLHDYRVALAKLRLQTGAESVDALLAAGTIEDYIPTDQRESDSGDDDEE